MAKRKKTAKKTKRTCPECGGPAKARGFIHAAGCSKASKKPATGKRRKRAASAAEPVSNPYGMAALRGLDVEELQALRGKVETVLAKKAPEVEAKIAELQATLKAIKGTAKK